jgi:FAD synthase
LRDELKFKTVDDLVEAMQVDLAKTKTYFNIT